MITFCLENLRSVYNVGSIFRTAEGFGFNNFALIGITPTPIDKNNNKRKDFIKTALGAEDRIYWQYFVDSITAINFYKSYHPDTQIVSIEINQTSEDVIKIKEYLNSIDTKDNNILIFFGSETDGVSESVLNISNKIYHIPMQGQKESFNVCVAAGIIMYITKNTL